MDGEVDGGGRPPHRRRRCGELISAVAVDIGILLNKEDDSEYICPVGDSDPGWSTDQGGEGNAGVGTLLLVRDLHWWTTDKEIESEAAKNGNVKEVRFFEEKETGKSKGYCHVEFDDPASATACKERMNGHSFNGKPCIVAFASPFVVAESEVRRKQVARGAAGSKKRAHDHGQQTGGPGFREGIGAFPPPMYPNSMMGHGFNPAFSGPMGRMATYGGYPIAPAPQFSGVLPSFAPPSGGMGFPGVPPPANLPFSGMRMMPGNVGGPNMRMWSGPSVGGWGGEARGGGRVGESIHGVEAAACDHQYGEVSHDRGGSDPRYRDNRDRDRDRDKGRDRYRGDRDRSAYYHRYRDSHEEHVKDQDRGQSSKSHGKSRLSRP